MYDTFTTYYIEMHEEENRKENNGDIKPPYFMS